MPHRRLLATAAALSMLAAAAVPALAQDERPHGPPEATPNPVALDAPAGDGTAVRLTTDLGHVVIGLFTESAPVAAENFLNLAREGYYDGVGFHRAVPGFVLQGGDPEGTGSGGPGYTISDEEVVGTYGRGVVAMARTPQPDSQGSQFFFVLDDAAAGSLEPVRTYTIFGRVIEGMDVVDAIVEAREPSDLIEDPIRIISTAVEQAELPPEPTAAPPSPAEEAAAALGDQLPESAGGFELQTATYTLEQVGSQLDPELIGQLQEVAEANGADVQLFSVAQAAGGDDNGFVSIAAASVPGVEGASVEEIVTSLLLAGSVPEEMTAETVGDREVTRVAIEGPQDAWVFSSGDVVWFVVTTLEDVAPIIDELP
jgi:cyclophilin family peptidyl-prolyl cis-trans isomerase